MIYNVYTVYDILYSSVITKNFSNYLERIHTEAYYIKRKRPSLNVRLDENFFELFSKMGSKKKIKKPFNSNI